MFRLSRSSEICRVIPDDAHWQERIRHAGPDTFDAVAMALYRWQYAANPVYREFCDLVHKAPARVHLVEDIPFLPVTLFRDLDIRSGTWAPETVFLSSGTTGSRPSRHAVRSLAWYHEVAETAFRAALGPPSRYAWLGLLPGYLERPSSSLVDMTTHFIRLSPYRESGFFLDESAQLAALILDLVRRQVPVILLGVTHALLQFAREHPARWGSGVMVMETGGMKGHGPELVRAEVHECLKTSLGVDCVHAEYGMTELFSQAYSHEEGKFRPGPAMRVTVRDIHDPFRFPGYGRPGLLCVMDLANYATQAFLATQDLGIVYPDGQFEVIGRQDGSEARGCNLMVLDRR